MSGISSKAENDRELVTVNFTYDVLGDKNARFKSGWVEFSPDDNWAVQRYRVKTFDDYFREVTIRYGDRESGFQPILEIVTEYFDNAEEDCAVRETVTFDKCEQCVFPEDFFSFTAVGLPDVKPPSGSWKWLVLVNAGVLLIVIAVFLKRRLIPRTESKQA